MFGLRKSFEGQSRLFFIAAAVLTVVAVGIVDYATRWEFSFSVFYLLAVGLAAWFVGRGFAYVIRFAVWWAGSPAIWQPAGGIPACSCHSGMRPWSWLSTSLLPACSCVCGS